MSQICGGYILYLDTLYRDTVFNVTEMYLHTFVNISNVTLTCLNTLKTYLNFGYMIVIETHIM